MQCPYCGGNGGSEAFINRGPDIRTHSFEWVECRLCGGSGAITDERHEFFVRGKAWRDARVARGESLLELSRRIGVGPAEISDREHGRGQKFQFDAFEKLLST